MDVAWGARTDKGHVRKINEDAYLTEPPVFLVADGMGGYQAGETASAAVIDEFRDADGAEVSPEWVTDRLVRAIDDDRLFGQNRHRVLAFRKRHADRQERRDYRSHHKRSDRLRHIPSTMRAPI